MISTSYGLPECFDSLAILGKADGEACAHSDGIEEIHSYTYRKSFRCPA